jgi:hypothetical protein
VVRHLVDARFTERRRMPRRFNYLTLSVASPELK